MALTPSRVELERRKFQEVSPGEPAVKCLSVDDRFVVEACDSVASATALNAASTGLAVDVDHKEGQYSIEWDKAADGAIKLAGVSFSPSSLNLSRYSDGKIKYYIYISDLTNVASCSLVIGTSAAHNNVYTTADSALSVGWNEISHDCDSPTSATGNGCIWGDIDYVSAYVTFDAAGNTLADMRLDCISVSNPVRVSLDGATISSTGVVTNAGTFAVQSATQASASSVGVSTLLDPDADNVKAVLSAAPCNLYNIHAYNSNAVASWIQVFDLAAGDVTIGVTTPKCSFFLPPDGAYQGDFDPPITFATACTYACTTTDNGAGDPTIGPVVNFFYKA